MWGSQPPPRHRHRWALDRPYTLPHTVSGAPSIHVRASSTYQPPSFPFAAGKTCGGRECECIEGVSQSVHWWVKHTAPPHQCPFAARLADERRQRVVVVVGSRCRDGNAATDTPATNRHPPTDRAQGRNSVGAWGWDDESGQAGGAAGMESASEPWVEGTRRTAVSEAPEMMVGGGMMRLRDPVLSRSRETGERACLVGWGVALANGS